MYKISRAEVHHILVKSAGMLRAQAEQLETKTAEIADLKQKIAQMERRVDAEKLAHDMHSRGLSTDLSVETLVNDLTKLSEEDYAVEKRATAKFGPNVGAHVGGLEDLTSRGGTASNAFDQWLLT